MMRELLIQNILCTLNFGGLDKDKHKFARLLTKNIFRYKVCTVNHNAQFVHELYV